MDGQTLKFVSGGGCRREGRGNTIEKGGHYCLVEMDVFDVRLNRQPCGVVPLFSGGAAYMPGMITLSVCD